jgi:hypothetical protein
VNNELKRRWKEAVVAKFKALSRRLPGKIKENHHKYQSGQPVSGPALETSFSQVFYLLTPSVALQFLKKHGRLTYPLTSTV